MTLYELWTYTSFCGKVRLYDDNGTNIWLERLTPLILDETHEYHYLENVEVEYFDIMTTGAPYEVALHIKLKEREN